MKIKKLEPFFGEGEKQQWSFIDIVKKVAFRLDVLIRLKRKSFGLVFFKLELILMFISAVL